MSCMQGMLIKWTWLSIHKFTKIVGIDTFIELWTKLRVRVNMKSKYWLEVKGTH